MPLTGIAIVENCELKMYFGLDKGSESDKNELRCAVLVLITLQEHEHFTIKNQLADNYGNHRTPNHNTDGTSVPNYY